MARISWKALASVVLVTACCSAACLAQEVKIETVLSALIHPSGVAIRPGGAGEPYEVFVAESGAQRIVKMRSDRPNQKANAIQGFDAAANDGDPLRSGSPLGLLFLDREHLVVGGSGSLPYVGLFEIGDANQPLSADQMKQRVALPVPPDVSELPYGGCYAFSRTRPNDLVPDMLLVAVVGDGRVSDIWKIRVRAGTMADMNRFGATIDDDAGTVPAAVAVSEQGFVLAARNGAKRDSLLTFQNPISGAAVMRLPTELHKIVGLAYSTRSPNLYALDQSTALPNDAGLFRMEDAGEAGRPALKAVRIQTIRKPTALAFGPDGALYVTAWNDADGRADQGVLLRITGDL